MRKLHIDGDEWSYQIGRTGVKLINPSGKGSFVNFPDLLGWTPKQVKQAQDDHVFAVTPSLVKQCLRGQKPPPYERGKLICQCCKKQDKTVHAGYNPFDAEIHQEYHYMIACEDCFDRIAEEI